VYRDRPRTLNELKTAITAYIRNISQADLQKLFANKIKRVQSCIDARGHHFQQLSKVHSDFPNADLQKVLANKIKRAQACIDARGHHFQHLS
jgi:arsenate reductase-like glutaredoxin family protein